MSTWTLSPCRKQRLSEVQRLHASLNADPAHTVVVTTQPDPIAATDVDAHVVVFDRPGMLFGEWFNAGLDFIATHETEPYEVFCVGSSLTGTRDTLHVLRTALRSGYSMVGPDLTYQTARGEARPLQGERTVHNRIPGVCFMVAGEHNLRFDPQFRWWYADDDFEMQHRTLGPVALVGTAMTYPAEHPLNAVQAAHATEDRSRFVAKWQQQPW